ncbi:MAG: hypothetical protein ACXWMN_00050 [Candidatus Limnocylindria bacterium]
MPLGFGLLVSALIAASTLLLAGLTLTATLRLGSTTARLAPLARAFEAAAPVWQRHLADARAGLAHAEARVEATRRQFDGFDRLVDRERGRIRALHASER